MARTAKITNANVAPSKNAGGLVGNTPVRAQDFNNLAGDYVSQTDTNAQVIASQLTVRGDILTNPGAPTEGLDGTGAIVLTIAQLLTQVLEGDPGGAGDWTTPTAALAVAGIPGVAVGDCLDFYIINNATLGANEIITLTMGTDVTPKGNVKIAAANVSEDQENSGSAKFRLRFTNVTSGSEACDLFRLA